MAFKQIRVWMVMMASHWVGQGTCTHYWFSSEAGSQVDFFDQTTKFQVLATCAATGVFNQSTVVTGDTNYTLCQQITTVTVNQTLQFSGSTVTVTGTSPWAIALDADSELRVSQSSTLVMNSAGSVIGSGVLAVDNTSAVNVSKAVTFQAPMAIDGVLRVLGDTTTIARTLYLTGTLAISSGATASVLQPLAWDPTTFETGSTVSGPGGLSFLSGHSIVNDASVTVPVTISRSSSASRRYSDAILTNGTINPIVTLCGTRNFASSSVSVGNGAGLAVNTGCSVSDTSIPAASASISPPVTIASGAYLVFDKVTSSSLPLYAKSAVTLASGSKLVALLDTSSNSGNWIAPVLRLASASCPSFSATLDGCEPTGCSLLSQTLGNDCELLVSHGLNFRSDAQQLVSLIPCDSLSPADFTRVVSKYTPTLIPNLDTVTVACGSSIVTFYCKASSSALANSICQTIRSNANVQKGLSAVPNPPSTSDSNGGLWALFALCALPLLLACGLLAMVLARQLRKRQHDKNIISEGKKEDWVPLYPALDHFAPLPPIHNRPPTSPIPFTPPVTTAHSLS